MIAKGIAGAMADREIAAIICPICHGTSFDHLKVENNYNWLSCNGCSFVRLAENTFDSDDGNAISYISGALRKFPKKQARARKHVKRMLGRHKGTTFLDVGCNLGFVTNEARARGLIATGLEMDELVVKFARSIFIDCDFICNTLDDAKLEGSHFDFVYCSEVVEHVIDVEGFLSEIKRVMRPPGLLYLTTPHIREYEKSSRLWGAPNHKVYFNDDNLTRLMRSIGFMDIKIAFNPWKGIELFARA